ncbi:jg6661 [Pararge aegeria aegeria]|uniref:Jg6661 protein n=1 Tax=Pararge aegeria aegeria TaxID=348720 RepID=A0A8S4R3V2_9NEOP|nr:jg6661 [Pararge aegeria aegeria]
MREIVSKWVEGEVLERKSPVSYVVKAKDGRIQKRHIDQILKDKRKSRHSLALVAPIGEDTPSSMTNKPVETEQWEDCQADIGGGLVSNSVECEETKLPGLEETGDSMRPRREAALEWVKKDKKKRVRSIMLL